MPIVIVSDMKVAEPVISHRSKVVVFISYSSVSIKYTHSNNNVKSGIRPWATKNLEYPFLDTNYLDTNYLGVISHKCIFISPI